MSRVWNLEVKKQNILGYSGVAGRQAYLEKSVMAVFVKFDTVLKKLSGTDLEVSNIIF